MKYIIYGLVIYMIYRFVSQMGVRHEHHVYHHSKPEKDKKPEVKITGQVRQGRDTDGKAGEYVDFEEIKD